MRTHARSLHFCKGCGIDSKRKFRLALRTKTVGKSTVSTGATRVHPGGRWIFHLRSWPHRVVHTGTDTDDPGEEKATFLAMMFPASTVRLLLWHYSHACFGKGLQDCSVTTYTSYFSTSLLMVGSTVSHELHFEERFRSVPAPPKSSELTLAAIG